MSPKSHDLVPMSQQPFQGPFLHGYNMGQDRQDVSSPAQPTQELVVMTPAGPRTIAVSLADHNKRRKDLSQAGTQQLAAQTAQPQASSSLQFQPGYDQAASPERSPLSWSPALHTEAPRHMQKPNKKLRRIIGGSVLAVAGLLTANQLAASSGQSYSIAGVTIDPGQIAIGKDLNPAPTAQAPLPAPSPGASPVPNTAPVDTTWVWPIRADELDTQSYALNQCWLQYYKPKGEYHAALDIDVTRKQVYAAHAGIVLVAGNKDKFHTTIIDTGIDPVTQKHLYMVYMHMGKILVHAGDAVTPDQPIGVSGDAGVPGAWHLHFGLSDSATAFGTYANPWHTANPIDYLPANKLLSTLHGPSSCTTAGIAKSAGFKQYKKKGSFARYTQP